LEIETAIVNVSEFTRRERVVGEDDVYNIEIMFTLGYGDVGVIKLDRANHAIEEAVQGWDPLGF
jgi:hypothetical protein